MFPEIIHHIIISKNTLECTQLNFFLKIFLEKHTLESSSNKIEQGYTHRTISTTQARCITIPPHYLKNYTPLFEHRFLPLKNDHSFRHPPPPPGNNRVCDHNAMSAFPQEKISHYTTGS